jgi:methionyl aminopeptidase
MIYLKSNAEIDIINENGKILAEVFEKLAELIKPGITTKDIDKAAENIIYSRSAVASFKNYRGFPAAVCVSLNEVVVHGIPSDRVLNEGDIVSVDIGAFKNGFHSDAARTYAVGQVSPEARRLIDVTRESFFEGIKYAAVGNRLSDISHAVQVHAESAGFGVVREMLGHGIGRSLHEDPPVPNYGLPGKGPKLRSGLCIAIEPMITQGDYNIVTMPDGWTTCTKDGKLAAHYENTVAITHAGCRILTLEGT